MEFIGMFEWRLIGVVVLLIICYIVVFPVRRARARTYVLKKKSEIADQLANAKISAANLKAGHGSLKALAGLEQGFRWFALLNAFRETDWVLRRTEIDIFEKELKLVIAAMLDSQPGK